MVSKVFQIWRAGFVRRWHQNFDLCDTVDYVAGHQGRVALLVLALRPHASRDLIIAALTHDQGEIRSGDLSYVVKRDAPDAARALADIECAEIESQGLPVVDLADHETRLLGLCDRLDSWLWMMRHKADLSGRQDWQDMLQDIRQTAIALGCQAQVAGVIDDAARVLGAGKLTVGERGALERFEDIGDIVVRTALRTGVAVADMVGPDRSRRLVRARWLAMYRCYLAGHSYSDIGRYFRRDHSTVSYAVGRCREGTLLAGAAE